jgi:hypothetical protein
MPDDRSLHVVAFNIPFPPDYGGIIDIYYKVKALHDVGVHVTLHCFQYGRRPDPELDSIADRVVYYPRKTGVLNFFSRLPYIVNTRVSDALKNNLLNDSDPVLFEGLHSTYLLNVCRDAGKKVAVRTHNIEHNYYRLLAKSERNLFRKLYLRIEARRLKKYEGILHHADHILSISTTDAEYFTGLYKRSHFIPAFQNQNEITCQAGKGDYILFHGNLGVSENDRAVRYLVSRVISQISHRTIIAGKNPARSIRRLCDQYPHVELISDPDNEQMSELISNAHINLLYTYQPTGLKLKLLHSLFAGRYCLANPLMLSGSGLEAMCEIYSTPLQAVEMIEQLMSMPFPQEKISERISALSGFDNLVNADRIKSILWEA